MNAEQAAQRILDGDLRVAARLMRDIDDGESAAVETLKLLHRHTGRAWITGLTGSPGVGKSTLTDALVTSFRAQGKSVGVVAVDPTSPFSGGAILGDRIRMQRHATDEGVFIRSLATRGHFGGLTASTRGVVTVMDAMGKDEALVETVGVGQDEVDIVRMADTTVIVVVPGLGDDIQAIKAGILEAGDVFVVNKMDREGAGRTAAELESMINLREEAGAKYGLWKPPVIMASACDGRGLEDLQAAIQGHRRVLLADGEALLLERRRDRARLELLQLIEGRIMARLQQKLREGQGLERLAEEIALRRKDPYTVCEEIMSNMFVL
jgi:LAO/AO transport system kinase